MNTSLKGRGIFDLVLPPEKVKKCMSRMSGKLSRAVLRRGRESNLSSLVEFTSNEFTSLLEGELVRISMDGKGRALDNIYIERFWKTLKYEDIYLYRYDTLKTLRKGLLKYFRFYNSVRPHQSLNGNSPDEIYFRESNLKVA